MKFARFVTVLIGLLLIFGCSRIADKKEQTLDSETKYYEFLKVNNDLTFSGVKELTQANLAGKEHYVFSYKKGVLTNIKSKSCLGASFYELNKYIFNVNKEWKEIIINNSTLQKQYTFTNHDELIRFDITCDEEGYPLKFKVIPFKITYDSFSILGNSVVYAGEFSYNEQHLIDVINWTGSEAVYNFKYNKENEVVRKSIYSQKQLRYEYEFELNKKGLIINIK